MSLDSSGCDRCGECPGGMFYRGWVASPQGILCHRCAEDRTQSGEPESQSLSEVFNKQRDGESEYLTLEARKDHRYCPHTSEILDGTDWSSLESYNFNSSCPECDPGPLDEGDVPRGHTLVAVVTGQIKPEETGVDKEPVETRLEVAADGGETRAE